MSHCPKGPFGGDMVEVPALQGGSYCVDATTVTNTQYAAFLAAHPTADDLSKECVEFPYDPPFAGFEPTVWPAPAGRDDHPVVHIHFCQAEAFCRKNAKRLCGRVGGGRLRNEITPSKVHDDPRDPTVGEWSNACSAGGKRPFAYGTALEAGRCTQNSDDPSVDQTTSVPEATCEGGFPGLFGMGGGVQEFIDSCVYEKQVGEDPGPVCALHKHRPDISDPAPCANLNVIHFGSSDGDVGVRCCADALTVP